MKRKHLAIAFLLLAAALFLPVIPCGLPADVWPEHEFEEVKADVAKVNQRLTGLALQRDKKEITPTYNLTGKYGTMSMYRSLLGYLRIGTSHQSIWAFGIPVLPSMPHVLLDHAKGTAQLTPQTLKAFLKWAESAEIDAAAKSYKTEGSAAAPSPAGPFDVTR